MNFYLKLLHHEPIEGEKPVMCTLFTIVGDRNSKLSLLEGMLYFDDEESFMELKSCPNILHLRLLYGERRLFILILKGKEAILVYYNIAKFPPFQELRPFVEKSSAEEGGYRRFVVFRFCYVRISHIVPHFS